MRRGRGQLPFLFRTHGGARKGAGRKRRVPGPRRVPHRKRPRLASRFPVHVTTSVRDGVPRLRSRGHCQVIRRAVFAVMDEPGFRICHFSVQRNHLHLVCEARDNAALARGSKRFKQRVARGINRQLGSRRGSVFLDRYHMEICNNPRQTRNVLVYVLNNGAPGKAWRRGSPGEATFRGYPTAQARRADSCRRRGSIQLRVLVWRLER